ncbi:hypothetical protein [Nonomuraea dietziae]|uniref:hypothetical protein n=1 Tax=Nonomuraea dietziae TaxID=65515 RepID=UPI0031D8A005
MAAGPSGVHAVGSTTAGFEGAASLGGLDGWAAGYAPDGTLQWTSAVGGPGEDRLNGRRRHHGRPRGRHRRERGRPAGAGLHRHGQAQLSATVATPPRTRARPSRRWRAERWRSSATPGAAWAWSRGGADILTVRLDGRGRQRAAAQLGSARDDGVDPFAEPNLYAATAPSGNVAISGLTYGGGGDGGVFQVTVDPATGLP